VPILTAPFDRGRLAWTPTVARPGLLRRPSAPFFSYALRVGAPWSHALDLFAGLPDGFLRGRSRLRAACSPRASSVPLTAASPWRTRATRRPPTLFFGPAGPLAVLLDVCDLLFAEDLDDAYHLHTSAGCTGNPLWSRVRAFTIDEHCQVLQRWRLVMGATLTPVWASVTRLKRFILPKTPLLGRTVHWCSHTSTLPASASAATPRQHTPASPTTSANTPHAPRSGRARPSAPCRSWGQVKE
jgi:hypothetical protein